MQIGFYIPALIWQGGGKELTKAVYNHMGSDRRLSRKEKKKKVRAQFRLKLKGAIGA